MDQFEETFTLCRDENERSAFIERLLAIAGDQPAKTTVVIALRADFYSHCAQYPLLRDRRRCGAGIYWPDDPGRIAPRH